MLADTSAINTFSAAQDRHADVLGAVGAVLASAQPDSGALGPAGAQFTQALADAVRRHVERVGLLGTAAADAGVTARATAAAYVAADADNGRALAEAGS